jgi:hypothetical protein
MSQRATATCPQHTATSDCVVAEMLRRCRATRPGHLRHASCVARVSPCREPVAQHILKHCDSFATSPAGDVVDTSREMSAASAAVLGHGRPHTWDKIFGMSRDTSAAGIESARFLQHFLRGRDTPGTGQKSRQIHPCRKSFAMSQTFGSTCPRHELREIALRCSRNAADMSRDLSAS